MPEQSDAIQIRHYRPEDGDDLWAILLAAFDDGELKGTWRGDVEGWHERLAADPSDTLVAIVDGQVAGLITPRRSQLVVGRAFRRRRVGRRLVEAAEASNRERDTGPLYLWLPQENEGALAFHTAIGYRYHHSLWNMKLREDAVVPAPAFPAVVVCRPYRYEDAVAYVDLVNAAFLDHPTPMSVSVERVRFTQSRPDFDPNNLLLLVPAEEPDRLIAFCRVIREEQDGRTVGEVAVLGVLPDWRRQGLGRELLRLGIRRIRELGAQDVFIVVEGANERALRLYEKSGFERVEEWPRYVRAVD